MTDCTKFIGTQGRLTSASPTRAGMMAMPIHPSRAKKAITSTCEKMLTARLSAGEHWSTTSGQPMCARLTEASAEP